MAGIAEQLARMGSTPVQVAHDNNRMRVYSEKTSYNPDGTMDDPVIHKGIWLLPSHLMLLLRSYVAERQKAGDPPEVIRQNLGLL